MAITRPVLIAAVKTADAQETAQNGPIITNSLVGIKYRI